MDWEDVPLNISVGGIGLVSAYSVLLTPPPQFHSSLSVSPIPVRVAILLLPFVAFSLRLQRRRTRGSSTEVSLYLFLAALVVYPLIWDVRAYSLLFFASLVFLTAVSRFRLLTFVVSVMLTVLFLELCRKQMAPDLSILAIFYCSGLLYANALVRALSRKWRQQAAMFDQARWAASELSTVTVHLGEAIQAARTQERARERKRIARQIHDSTGHSLTALIVQLGILKEMSEGVEMHDRISRVENLASSTLKQLRSEVSELRTTKDGAIETTDWQQRLYQLAEAYTECTGVHIDISFGKDIRLVGSAAEEIYRICQEALTNAYRHGRASLVDIAMDVRDGNRALLRVSDNGRGARTVHRGNGLEGLSERVAALGGELALRTRENKGFDIGVVVPWPLVRNERGKT